ncbi:MAG: DUF2085 domain-containing protein [Candidatus Aminicenantes bacterium]|nr:DUF2085 domain-containing protein [Candidatus Aminicenantes bacterium]
MTENKTIRNVFAWTLGGISAWLMVIFSAPYLKNLDLPLSAFLYSIFSPICHQNPTRCFYLFGNPLAVCTRCLGIYFGFFLGTLLFPLINGLTTVKPPEKLLFVILSIPIATDTLANLFSLWHTSDWLRAVIGLIWGWILPYYFIAGVSEMFLEHKHFSLKKEQKTK